MENIWILWTVYNEQYTVQNMYSILYLPEKVLRTAEHATAKVTLVAVFV
jgi:hypothetical protein